MYKTHVSHYFQTEELWDVFCPQFRPTLQWQSHTCLSPHRSARADLPRPPLEVEHFQRVCRGPMQRWNPSSSHHHTPLHHRHPSCLRGTSWSLGSLGPASNTVQQQLCQCISIFKAGFITNKINQTSFENFAKWIKLNGTASSFTFHSQCKCIDNLTVMTK